jgi:DNA-binding transcriptional regulator of glucitol operon
MHPLADSSGGSAALGIIVWIVVIAVYWAPTITSAIRHLPDTGTVAVWNFFGWFFLVPWIVAMAKAARSRPQPGPQYVVPPGFQPQWAQQTTTGTPSLPRDDAPVIQVQSPLDSRPPEEGRHPWLPNDRGGWP